MCLRSLTIMRLSVYFILGVLCFSEGYVEEDDSEEHSNNHDGWIPQEIFDTWKEEHPYINNTLYPGFPEPLNWHQQYNQCGGREQSPIDIKLSSLKRKIVQKPLSWKNFRQIPASMKVLHTGDTVQVEGEWDPGYKPCISQGPLKYEYFFDQIHFHWGSEHTVNDKRFPLELHLVMRRSDSCKKRGNCDRNENVVISYFFKISKSPNPVIKHILESSPRSKGKKRLNTFALHDFDFFFDDEYAFYEGSLTTPPCNEDVIWLIPDKWFTLSEQQLHEFRKQFEYKNNHRPVQKLNGRKVYYVTNRKYEGRPTTEKPSKPFQITDKPSRPHYPTERPNRPYYSTERPNRPYYPTDRPNRKDSNYDTERPNRPYFTTEKQIWPRPDDNDERPSWPDQNYEQSRPTPYETSRNPSRPYQTTNRPKRPYQTNEYRPNENGQPWRHVEDGSHESSWSH